MSRFLLHKSIPPAACTRPYTCVPLSALSLMISYHRTYTLQGAESPVRKLEAILAEQQDHRAFAAHSSFGWSAGERGQFEITKPFLQCESAVPTTEPQPLKAVEKCAAVLPGKAPSATKINPPPTKKRAAKAKAPAPPKTQAQSWRSTVSVLMAAFLVALVAMSGPAFGSKEATSLASAGGAQPALYTNTTGGVVACHPGIYFDPISNMANDQSSVLSACDDLLHGEAVCGKLSVRCNAAGLMTKAMHANMLRPSTPGLGGFQLSDWHQNATEGLPCTPKSLPCMHYLKLPVPTISNDGRMSSFLATAKEANLLAGFAKESASLAEQVTACAHMPLRHRTCAAPSPHALLHFLALLHSGPFPAR